MTTGLTSNSSSMKRDPDNTLPKNNDDTGIGSAKTKKRTRNEINQNENGIGKAKKQKKNKSPNKKKKKSKKEERDRKKSKEQETFEEIDSSMTTNTAMPLVTVTNVWGAIKSSKVIDGFLELPVKAPSFTKITKVSSLYIRQDYVEIFDLIKNHVNEIRARDDTDIIHIVVTGTPGIGKSWFAHYFLWRSLEDQTFKNMKRYFQSAPDCIEHLTDDGEMIELTKKQKKIASKDPETLLLVDMEERTGPVRWVGVTIVLSSPDPARFKEFMKQDNAVQYFMNPWPYECIRKVWEKKYQGIVSLEDVKKIFQIYGGVIRFVLGRNKFAVEEMNKAFEKISSFKDLAKCISGNAVDDSIVTYKIVHYKTVNDERTEAKLYLASVEVADRLFEKIVTENLDEALTFLGGSQMGYVQSTMGQLFEAMVHIRICKNGLPALRRLQPKKRNAIAPPVPESFPLSTIQFTNAEPEIVHNMSTLQQLSKGVYYRPDIANQESLDSFAVIGNNVLAFQITVAQKHQVLASGMNDLHNLVVRCFPGEAFNYHLVFLCLKGKVNTSKFKWQTIVPMPSGALPFEMNQWIVELQFLPSYLAHFKKQ